MKRYKYEARNQDGAIMKGTVDARSSDSVVEILHGKNLVVVDIKEDIGLSLGRLQEINIGGVPMKEKVVFMRQLSTMISAGLPLTQSLEILESQITNPQFKRVVSEVLSDVEGGMSLATSFRNQPDIFDDIVISLIAAGEESGHLEEILQRVALELENKKKLNDKIRSAFTYPVIIVIVMLVVVVLLMVVLVPAMEEIYSEFDAQLPWVTRLLIVISNFTMNYWWLLLISLAFLVIGIKSFGETDKGRKFFHKLMLQVPVFGPLSTKIQLTQFTRTLALLLKSGISIIEALNLTSDALSNVHYKAAVLNAKNEVEKGVPLTVPLARNEFFPMIVSQMIAVGEESGELDMVLDKMADYYNQEVEVLTSNLSTMLEPFILIIMGGMIGFVALAVYMPMFSLTEVIG